MNLLRTIFYSLVAGVCIPAAAQQVANFNSLDGTVLKALVFHPAPVAVGEARRGTVIALHGCGGLHATSGSRKGKLNARHQGMADMLMGEGYNVVFPDSFTPRGETERCTQKIGTRKIDQTQRRADALAALAWVAAQPWAEPGRVALLDWSHGGSAVLASTDLSRADVRGQAVKPAVAVAFYPGCAAATNAV